MSYGFPSEEKERKILFSFIHSDLCAISDSLWTYFLTGRYGANAPQASATNNRLSGYLWLIFREREQYLKSEKCWRKQGRREVDWRAAITEWKTTHVSSTCWPCGNGYRALQSHSQAPTAVKHTHMRWHRWQWKPDWALTFKDNTKVKMKKTLLY